MFRRIYPPSEPPGGTPLWAIIRGADLVALTDSLGLLEQLHELAIDQATAILIGAIGERPVYATEIPADMALPSGLMPYGLRTLLADAEPLLAGVADYAVQLTRWMRTSRYCSACGQPLALADGWGKRCAACGHTAYPPVSPAIIVLVHDGERALLTTKAGWGRRYSLVAGFVEPGETFEECVAREVQEEVGVAVGQIQYVESQSWPFPHQIMVGFLARYASGEIAIDTAELADARWFTRDDLPELPPPYTISRRIINRWLQGQLN
jgi:NAD+ diphosphatase